MNEAIDRIREAAPRTTRRRSGIWPSAMRRETA